MIPNGVYYLNNSGLIVEGIRIWGSPVTPYHLGMAFNKKPGAEIKEVWDGLPSMNDILDLFGNSFFKIQVNRSVVKRCY